MFPSANAATQRTSILWSCSITSTRWGTTRRSRMAPAPRPPRSGGHVPAIQAHVPAGGSPGSERPQGIGCLPLDFRVPVVQEPDKAGHIPCFFQCGDVRLPDRGELQEGHTGRKIIKACMEAGDILML